MSHLNRIAGVIFCGLAFATVLPQNARAEDDELAKQERTLESSSKGADYRARLKERYNLTDAQLKSLSDRGMNDAQITMTAQLAKSSGKSIDEIVKMRLDDKMGWGKIAKELGVPPREIGQSIASMHRNEREGKNLEKREQRRENRRHEREERKAERREHRSERKEKRGNG